jgi:hypothetical protein
MECMTSNFQTILQKTKAWVPILNNHIQNAVRSLTDEDAIDLILDARDCDPFDGQWVELNAKLASAKSSLDNAFATTLSDFLDEQRMSCYKYVIKQSHSSDLAAYVSEDLELILGCLVLVVCDEFLKSMIFAYSQETIPDNSMALTSSFPVEIDWMET